LLEFDAKNRASKSRGNPYFLGRDSYLEVIVGVALRPYI
jgi:hypothetical protein